MGGGGGGSLHTVLVSRLVLGKSLQPCRVTHDLPLFQLKCHRRVRTRLPGSGKLRDSSVCVLLPPSRARAVRPSWALVHSPTCLRWTVSLGGCVRVLPVPSRFAVTAGALGFNVCLAFSVPLAVGALFRDTTGAGHWVVLPRPRDGTPTVSGPSSRSADVPPEGRSGLSLDDRVGV